MSYSFDLMFAENQMRSEGAESKKGENMKLYRNTTAGENCKPNSCCVQENFEAEAAPFGRGNSLDCPYTIYREAAFLPWETVDRIIEDWSKKFFADYPIEGIEFNVAMSTVQLVSMTFSGSELGLSLTEYIEKLVALYGKPDCGYDPKHDLCINGTHAYTRFSKEMSRNILAAAVAEAGLDLPIDRLICDEDGVVIMSE